MYYSTDILFSKQQTSAWYRYTKYAIILVLIYLFCSTTSSAQFYNGLRMDFGKNRVQYNDLFWSFYRFDRFDAYYHIDSKELSEYASAFIYNRLHEIENYFEYTLERRIVLIVYSKQSFFTQSNIGLDRGDEHNIGGVTKIIDNKVFVYFDGDHRKFEQQITAALTEVMINEMLYGGNVRDKVASSTLLNLPEWYVKGLVSYVSDNWNISIENKVKDGIMSGKYNKFNRLSGVDAEYAGHSLWRFIADTYGKSVIPNIVYLTKINRNYDSGFLFVLGSSLKMLTPEWIDYYKTRYEADEKLRDSRKKSIVKTKKNVVYQRVKVDPTGQYVAYVSNASGRYKIWLYDTTTHKRKVIYKRGHKLDQITDYSFPLLAWHPSGEILSVITEDKGKTLLVFYSLKTNKMEFRQLFSDIQTRRLFYFDKIIDFSYSKDGMKLAISAEREGRTDIYVYNLSSNMAEQLTFDLAEDYNPRFINNDQQIIFSSNRKSDTLFVEKNTTKPVLRTTDLFVYDLKTRSKYLKRISSTPFANEILPYETNDLKYLYLSDENGIVNRHVAKYDSTISHVDTTIHYRYLTTVKPVSNYSRNIEEQDINRRGKYFGEIVFWDERYRIYTGKVETTVDSLPEKLPITDYKKLQIVSWLRDDSTKRVEREMKAIHREQLKQKAIRDSIEQAQLKALQPINPDSNLININDYQFEREKGFTPVVYTRIQDSLDKVVEADTFKLPKAHVYLTNFYINQLVNQIDFGFLNSSYQAFTGGAVYFNPGGNLLFKVGAIDLFEDYKLTAGFRFSGNFDSNEYLLSLDDYKTRLDKQYIFHRQTFMSEVARNPAPIFLQVNTSEAMYVLKYPFSQVNALKATFTLRFDKTFYKSTELRTLFTSTEYKTWAGIKLEYIFDNTTNKGINLYNGSRYKLFGEFYKQLDGKNTDLFVVGADFRHYQKIHRQVIFASRFAASTSFGRSRLIYYLGGVDNWTNLSRDVQTFIPLDEVPINRNHNYVYQTVATNMRGFPQNVRNGNSFIVINNELRIPVFRYLLNRPINSDFLNNFQIIGFGDIGTAWSGATPYSKENAYNSLVVENGSITVTIDQDKPPFVAGYGFGVRSRLLGYFVRLDWAWGIEDNAILPRIFYLSLDLDF